MHFCRSETTTSNAITNATLYMLCRLFLLPLSLYLSHYSIPIIYNSIYVSDIFINETCLIMLVFWLCLCYKNDDGFPICFIQQMGVDSVMTYFCNTNQIIFSTYFATKIAFLRNSQQDSCEVFLFTSLSSFYILIKKFLLTWQAYRAMKGFILISLCILIILIKLFN